MGNSLDLFAPATRDWFRGAFADPTQVQERGWQEVAAGRHVLMAAPTGSGKTLAAFLWCLDRLTAEPTPTEGERCRVLYVSPMKALAHDIDRNLRSPLVGIGHQMEATGLVAPDISVAIRTGDTPTEVRRSMERHPPDILITTPESLYLLLTSAARRILASVRWLIVDEIHSVAATKRGSHLALSLERLCALTKTEPQRIGLSATQRPLEEVARFLGGTNREVAIVDAGRLKTMDVRVEVPVDDMARLSVEDENGRPAGSIWPAIYPRLLALIRDHRSTIVFVNSRRLAERLAARINELAGEDLVLAHHGSIAREQRLVIEDQLKAGVVRGLIATSTLELGIDMGAVDLVLQVEAPPSVAAGIQRVGRAGHSVGEVSRGVVIPNFRGGLLESAAVVEGMLEGRIESTVVPRKPLDVLAQQVVAICAMDEWHVDELATLVRRAYPYSDLGPRALESVLDMLSGRYPSDEFAELRPRIVWDRVAGTIRGRAGAQRLAVTNPGTIPDRGLYSVNLVDDGRRVVGHRGGVDVEASAARRLECAALQVVDELDGRGATRWADAHVLLGGAGRQHLGAVGDAADGVEAGVVELCVATHDVVPGSVTLPFGALHGAGGRAHAATDDDNEKAGEQPCEVHTPQTRAAEIVALIHARIATSVRESFDGEAFGKRPVRHGEKPPSTISERPSPESPR